MTEHPTPRFEMVHKLYLATVTEQRLMDAEPTVGAHEPNPQPWHVRAISENGEVLDSTETFVTRTAVFTNLIARARMLGVEAGVSRDGGRYALVGTNLHIPIVVVEVEP